MDDNHTFSAITDFDGLRWWRPEIIVGDGPDALTCRFYFKSKIRHCHPSQGFIQFINGRIFYPNRGCLSDGTPAYLFYPGKIGEIYTRRMLEYPIEDWLKTAPLGEARIVGGWLLEAAGSPRDLSWIPLGFVWAQVESHLLNVGLRDLQLIGGLIAPRKAASEAPSPPLAVAG